MGRLNLELPDDLQARLQARAAETGFESIEGYIEALIRADDDTIDHDAPEQLRFRSHDELAEKVRDGLTTPSTEMTAADWEDLRRKLAERRSG
jgi:hypothetical protein